MKPLNLTPQGNPFLEKELTTPSPVGKAGRSTPDSGASALCRSVHSISNDTSEVPRDQELRALFAIIRKDPGLQLTDAITQVKRLGEKAAGSDINSVRDMKGSWRSLSPYSAWRAGSGGATSGTATGVKPSGKEGDSRSFQAAPAMIEPAESETASTLVQDTTPDLTTPDLAPQETPDLAPQEAPNPPPQEQMSAEDKVLTFFDKSLEAHDDIHDGDATNDDPEGRQIWGLTDNDPISAEEVEQDVLGTLVSDSAAHQIPEDPGDPGAESSDESDEPTAALVASLTMPPTQKTTTSIFGDGDNGASSVSGEGALFSKPEDIRDDLSVSSEGTLLPEREDISDNESVSSEGTLLPEREDIRDDLSVSSEDSFHSARENISDDESVSSEGTLLPEREDISDNESVSSEDSFQTAQGDISEDEFHSADESNEFEPSPSQAQLAKKYQNVPSPTIHGPHEPSEDPGQE